MHAEARTPITGEGLSFAGLGQAGALRLLALALVNSLPVAITSTPSRWMIAIVDAFDTITAG